MGKKPALELTRLFLVGLIVGLIFQMLSIYLYVYPQSTVHSQRFVLENFQLVPWVSCCFYYDPTPIILMPGDKLTGQVQMFYESELPSDLALPYFFLVAASQFTLDNSQAGFRDHVYMSSFANVTKDFQQRAIMISYSIRTVSDNAAHYFILLPQSGQNVLHKTLVVQGSVERLVPERSLGIIAQVLSLVSFVALGIDRTRLRKRG
jgi:hypothetical protein